MERTFEMVLNCFQFGWRNVSQLTNGKRMEHALSWDHHQRGLVGVIILYVQNYIGNHLLAGFSSRVTVHIAMCHRNYIRDQQPSDIKKTQTPLLQPMNKWRK